MATAPTRRRRRGATAAEPADAAAPTTEAATATPENKEDKEAKAKEAAEQREAKRSERANQEKAQTETLLARTGEHPRVPNRDVGDDEPIADVARDLKITSGKAAFLLMKDAVAKGKVPAIKGADDDALVAGIIEARKKADEYSSWGWLAARSGKAESWIKLELEDAGAYEPKAENISSIRAQAREEAKPAETAAAPAAEGDEAPKPARRRRTRGNAS